MNVSKRNLVLILSFKHASVFISQIVCIIYVSEGKLLIWTSVGNEKEKHQYP